MTVAGSLGSTQTGVPVAVARQPILDRTEEIRGYELLYRSAGAGPVGVGGDGVDATSNVIVRALADIGLDALVGDHKAWVNVTREFLLEVRPLPLPPDRTVIELLEGQAVDAELLDVLGELRDAGFRIALDDFRFDPGWEELVQHADACKLDIRELPGDALAGAVSGYAVPACTCSPRRSRRARSTSTAARSASTPSRATSSPSRCWWRAAPSRRTGSAASPGSRKQATTPASRSSSA